MTKEKLTLVMTREECIVGKRKDVFHTGSGGFKSEVIVNAFNFRIICSSPGGWETIFSVMISHASNTHIYVIPPCVDHNIKMIASHQHNFRPLFSAF